MNTQLNFPADNNMATFFLDSQRPPSNVFTTAILCGKEELTYSAVQFAANMYAAALYRIGVCGDHVLLAMRDGPDFIAAFFAILKIGAIAIPVNADFSTAEFEKFLRYTRARFAVVDHAVLDTFLPATEGLESFSHTLTDVGENAERVTSLDAIIDSLDEWETNATMSQGNPAVMLFTGGSTGEPKGVLLGHRAFIAQAQLYAREVLGITEKDTVICVPKLNFGYALGVVLFAFSVGAKVVLYPDKPTPELLFELVWRYQATILVNMPTMIARMVADPGASAADLSSLRLMTSAGEPLEPALYERCCATFGRPVFNGLGTAELWHIFVSGRLNDRQADTVGTVVAGFEIKVCAEGDEVGTPLPDGTVGLMWARGPSLAMGYWQHPTLTAAAFRNGWFASQDLVRRRSDGHVEYLGRADDAMKVAGKFVSLIEIQNAVMQVAGVVQCAAVDVTSAKDLKKPVVFVIGRASETFASAIVTRVEAHLMTVFSRERYMLPKAIVVVDGPFPTTHLGKVDKRALKEQYRSRLHALNLEP